MISVFVVNNNADLMQRVMQLLEVQSTDLIHYFNGLLIINSDHDESQIEAFIKNKVKEMGLEQMYDNTKEHTKFSTKIKAYDYELAICLLNSIPSLRKNNTLENIQYKLIEGDPYNIVI
jgi:hypothetical protein